MKTGRENYTFSQGVLENRTIYLKKKSYHFLYMNFPVFRNPLEKCVVFTSGFHRFSPVFTAGFHGRLPWGPQPQRTVYRQAEPLNPSEKNVAPSVTAAIRQDQSAGGNVANSPPPPTEAMLIFFWKVVPRRGAKPQHCLWGTGEFFSYNVRCDIYFWTGGSMFNPIAMRK